ncbi:MAG: VWA domain-containing protein [Prevotellaceae bacterium]|jgi:Ca-activated chloride channel family protein|nr:VWA domain-containing protein [Prevotellaceae bacterium]
MFRFANTYFIYLLLLIPLLISFYAYGRMKRRKRLAQFGNPSTLATLMPNVSNGRPTAKFVLLLTGITLIIFSLARPQFGSKLQTVKKQGIEAMIVLDVSNSMLARDVHPNRLEYAKMMLSKLIDQMSDDKVGLIVFAGDAYIQMPISSDNVSAKMFLSSINTKTVPRAGTAIGSAIELAMKAFGTRKNDVGRTIILITDGENHEDNAERAAKLASEQGITLHVIGLGRPEGTPILVDGTMAFLKDRNGEVVVTKLNETLCKQIAGIGQGIYVRADNSGAALKALSNAIDKMQKGELETKSYSEYEEKFYIPAWIALFLLFIEYFIYNRKNKQLKKIRLFDR